MFFCRRDVLLCLRTDGAIVENGPADNAVLSVIDEDCRVNEIAIFIVVPNPEFGELAGSSTVRISWQLTHVIARVHKAKSSLRRMVLLIDFLIPSKCVTGGSTIPLLTLCVPLKLGVLNPAGASAADFAATLASPVPNAISTAKRQEQRRAFLQWSVSIWVLPKDTGRLRACGTQPG
jgi:hypothetical protein